MDLVEDLSPFFAEFADEGLLAGKTVRGICMQNTEAPLLGQQVVLAEDPVYMLPSASVPPGVTGMVLSIPQGSFRVRRAEGTTPSITVLYLELP